MSPSTKMHQLGARCAPLRAPWRSPCRWFCVRWRVLTPARRAIGDRVVGRAVGDHQDLVRATGRAEHRENVAQSRALVVGGDDRGHPHAARLAGPLQGRRPAGRRYLSRSLRADQIRRRGGGRGFGPQRAAGQDPGVAGQAPAARCGRRRSRPRLPSRSRPPVTALSGSVAIPSATPVAAAARTPLPQARVSASTPRSKVRISRRSGRGKRTKSTLAPASPNSGWRRSAGPSSATGSPRQALRPEEHEVRHADHSGSSRGQASPAQLGAATSRGEASAARARARSGRAAAARARSGPAPVVIVSSSPAQPSSNASRAAQRVPLMHKAARPAVGVPIVHARARRIAPRARRGRRRRARRRAGTRRRCARRTGRAPARPGPGSRCRRR